MECYSGRPALHPFGASLRLFKIVPDDFVAPNSGWREQVTPGNKGNGSEVQAEHEEEEETRKAKRRGMSWAQRLKRVFGIDVKVCPHCGGGVRIIACIEDPLVIRQILSQLEAKQTFKRQQAGDLPPSRAPPRFGLFG